MRSVRLRSLAGFLVLFLLVMGVRCKDEQQVAEETKSPAVKPHDPKMKETTVDVFPGMNGPNTYTAEELSGRILWNLWTGDNAGFWNHLSQNGFGTSDLLKTIDSRQRSTRFARIGVMNQPGFQASMTPDQYGLFLDKPKPGDPDGEIDKNIDYYTYGRSSGVVGLRIYDNPAFTGAAKDKWMARIGPDGANSDYYNDPSYYNDKNLVRPYMVGMTCAFCHVGPDPVRPPANPEEPKWENLNDYIGAQYLSVAAVFGNGMGGDSFVWQLLNSNPRGTLDTSFISTDYLNNPGTMNAVFAIPQRVSRAEPEKVTGGALALLNVKDPVTTPRVLKDGSDSVGFEAALSRVHLNIGEDWKEWITHFNLLIGGKKQTPYSVAKAQATSPYWNWSEERSPNLAKYFIKTAKPLLLKDAPGGGAYLSSDQTVLNRGKIVFAQNCARCHSSKQPPTGTDPASAAGTAWFEQQVQSDPNFFTDNFLGDERRHPVDVIGTNATRAAGSNAIRGHIWDNFSSETYKTLPQIKPIKLTNPFDDSTFDFQMPGGGRGYYRPPSLISVWATAPYLHNNMVGIHNNDPSVAGRMAAFNDGIQKMLWPEKRLGKGSIWRTTQKSYILVPVSYIPDVLRHLVRDPELVDANGNLKVGPIPKGTPVNLLSNVNLEANVVDLARLLIDIAKALVVIDKLRLSDAAATAKLKELVPQLMKVNTCPDFIEDKGHLFGTGLPDSDKRALIELLKTF